MKPLMLGIFLSGLLCIAGCGPSPNIDNTQENPKTTPVRVNSKKTCCGEVCACPQCECCGACQSFTSKETKDVFKPEKIDMSKVE
jgi:hypothetical protein